jgi:hypothetical protein
MQANSVLFSQYKPHPMRKRLHYLHVTAFVLLFFVQARTQTVLDTTFAAQTNYIFANVDKSKILHGLLIDYGMEFTDLTQYNGVATLADSNKCDLRSFYDVYNSLVMSRVNSSVTIFSRQGNLDSIWFGYRQPGRITLMGLYINYSRFKDNAANTFITITNNRLYDKYVNGVWQNPYQVERAFVVCPSIQEYSGKSFEVLLPPVLFVKNVASYTISADFHDGLGYRTVTPGTPINVTYADTGVYKWTYRINVAGINYHCESFIRIVPAHTQTITLFLDRKNRDLHAS